MTCTVLIIVMVEYEISIKKVQCWRLGPQLVEPVTKRLIDPGGSDFPEELILWSIHNLLPLLIGGEVNLTAGRWVTGYLVPLSASWLPWGEYPYPTMPFYHYAHPTGPETVESSNYELRQIHSHNKYFFKLFPCVFCHRIPKLASTCS